MGQSESVELVRATAVRFIDDTLEVSLSDGRRVILPLGQMSWLAWLREATREQRANWSIEPGGYAVYWEDLDDGVEVMHLLHAQPL